MDSNELFKLFHVESKTSCVNFFRLRQAPSPQSSSLLWGRWVLSSCWGPPSSAQVALDAQSSNALGVGFSLLPTIGLSIYKTKTCVWWREFSQFPLTSLLGRLTTIILSRIFAAELPVQIFFFFLFFKFKDHVTGWLQCLQYILEVSLIILLEV